MNSKHNRKYKCPDVAGVQATLFPGKIKFRKTAIRKKKGKKKVEQSGKTGNPGKTGKVPSLIMTALMPYLFMFPMVQFKHRNSLDAITSQCSRERDNVAKDLLSDHSTGQSLKIRRQNNHIY